MYHSIIISGKNLYDEWGLIPTSRPLVNPPEVKTTYVKNPGSDGSLDFTDNLTGETQYSSRKGSWEFWTRPEDQWADIYSAVMNYLHGIEHDVILEDEPKSTYHGRLSVSSWKSDKHNSLLVIDYVLDPYKECSEDNPFLAIEDWFTDPDQYITLKIKNGCKRVILLKNEKDYDIHPRFYASKPISISAFEINNPAIVERPDMFYFTNYDSLSILGSVNILEGYNNKNNILVLHPGNNYWEINNTLNGNDSDQAILKVAYKVITL